MEIIHFSKLRFIHSGDIFEIYLFGQKFSMNGFKKVVKFHFKSFFPNLFAFVGSLISIVDNQHYNDVYAS